MVVRYEPTLDEALDEDGNTRAYVIIGASIITDIRYRMVEDGFAAASYPEGKPVPRKPSLYEPREEIAVDQKTGIWAS